MLKKRSNDFLKNKKNSSNFGGLVVYSLILK
jgi:hypothetical protein